MKNKYPKVNIIPTPKSTGGVVNIEADRLVCMKVVLEGFIKNCDTNETMVELRFGGNIHERAIFLNPCYDWQLVMDGASLVLLPTKK